jgi:hypothetical protein
MSSCNRSNADFIGLILCSNLLFFIRDLRWLNSMDVLISTNFTFKKFKDYCEGLGIQLNFTSIAHPQTNGQVKKANGLICNGLKNRLMAPLERDSHAWVMSYPP